MANKQRAAKPAQNDSPPPGTSAGSETGTTGPDAGAGTEGGTGTGAGAGTGLDVGTGTEGGTGTGADAGTGLDVGTGAEGGTGTGADAGTGPDVGTGTRTGSEDAATSVDGRVRVRLLCTNHLGQIGDIVTVPTGHVYALRSGGLADPHSAALEAGE